MVVRSLVSADITALLRLQEEAYIPELLETKLAFLRKIQIFPDGCLCVELDSEISAYAISHPWRGDEAVEIGAHDLVIPECPDCYYIHDLVVEQKYRKNGLAGDLVRRLCHVARVRDLAKMVLISVQRSEQFWEHFGFRRVRKLSYGIDAPATYMVRLTDSYDCS